MGRLAYVCEGGSGIGWGHVGRGRALAEVHPDVTLVIGRGYDEIQSWILSAGSRLKIQRWDEDLAPVSFRRGEWSTVIVDAYDVSNSWIADAGEHWRVAVVDDWQRDLFSCDLLVNANVGAAAADYSGARCERGLFGPRYAFVRQEIRALRGARSSHADGRRRVVLSLGGSDPADVTGRLLDALEHSGLLRDVSLDVIVGASYRGRVGFGDSRAEENIRVLRQPPQFASLLAAADLVVCGGSVTSYEAACLGKPFIPVAIVENQRRIAARWAELGWGVGISIDEPSWTQSFAEVFERYLADFSALRARATTLMSLVDGEGPRRIREAVA